MRERQQLITADDGCQLWTATSGSGRPVVLCHGGPGFWDDLAPVASMIDDLATVHRWDQRGAGRSSRIGPYPSGRFVEDLDALRRHWGYETWVAGGHSWGATLALLYALAHSEHIRALIYISGVGIGQAGTMRTGRNACAGWGSTARAGSSCGRSRAARLRNASTPRLPGRRTTPIE